MRTTIKTSLVSAVVVAAVQLAASAALAGSVPPLAPLGDPPIPLDNKQTAAKVALGKMLFWDPRIGGDASTACVTCHNPKMGWGFADDISRGYPGTVHWRNSQTVVNSAYYGHLFWAGSVGSLEAQAPSAAKGAVAGNGELDVIEARMAFIPEYRKAFNDVFGDQWPLLKNAWRAIAAFERTLIQNDTPVDKYLAGDKSALTAQQVRGKALFEGKARCIQCHNGSLATDQKYYNIGVPTLERWQTDPLAQITFRFENFAKGVSEDMYRTVKEDAGFYFRTKLSSDKGKFRTAPLRYTKYTSPYMHNGAFWTLAEVVDFYDRGGDKNDYSANKTSMIQPLHLSDKEKEDLVAFLEGFSGPEIKIKPPVLPGYKPLPKMASE